MYKKITVVVLSAVGALAILSAVLFSASLRESGEETGTGDGSEGLPAVSDELLESAVNFHHELDDYVPKKDHYSFYFTYKTIHPWWDAVGLGMEDALRQYQDRGVTITDE